MNIWVDADACPKQIKDILFRAANRSKTQLTLVSNHAISSPPSPFIKKIQVPSGFDVADDKIVALIKPNDLVITADIPLADAVVQNGAAALNPRGKLYTIDNIKESLALRNLSTDLRNSGLASSSTKSLSKRDIQKFSNELDKYLSQQHRSY